MGIGPVFDCPNELAERLPAIFAEDNIRVECVPDGGCTGIGTELQFRRRLGRINGYKRNRDGRTLIWLTFPRAHSLNPLLWYFDFSLSKSIEQRLQHAGAIRTYWTEFGDATAP